MRKSLKMGTTLTLALVLAAAVGCSSHHPSPKPGPLPKVHHNKAEVPKDRDEQAVAAALRRLDPCDLIDPSGASTTLFPSKLDPRPRSPHRCELVSGTYDQLDVTIGTPLPAADRYAQRRLDLAGATAYLNQSAGQCRLAVPVSFTLAVEFRADLIGPGEAGQCEKVITAFGSAAVPKLAKPAAFRNRRPMAQRDSCAVLRSALGAKQRGLVLQYGEFTYGIDRCEAWSGNGVRPDYYLELEYGADPSLDRGNETKTIAGRKVDVEKIPECVLSWRQAPSGFKNGDSQNVTISAGCGDAEKLAASAMRLLAKPAPASHVVPQRTLTYRSTEPDVAAAGACVDLGVKQTCEPYHPVSAPHGDREVLRRVAADPNVDCAIAADAVRKHLGARMRPVVESAAKVRQPRCVFVEPTHAVRLTISVDEGATYNTASKPVKIAGRNTWTVSDPEGRDLAAEIDGGMMEINLSIAPPRGAQTLRSADSQKLTELSPITADIIGEYF